MNVLIVNTFHYFRGGDCTYSFKLADLLMNRGGHHIVNFAMAHPNNLACEYSDFFVPEIDLMEELEKKNLASGWHVMKRSIYSNEAKKKLFKLLQKYPVRIAHIQNIHSHITPSIFHVFKKQNIPIIWTLHDYFLLCPKSTLYRVIGACEMCRGNRFYNVVVRRCRKDSIAASLVVMIEEYAHRLMGLLKLVDYFVTPSMFMKEKMIEYGFPRCKIKYIPNFIEAENGDAESSKGDYGLYVGRISYEKGLSTLIKAWANIPDFKLVIAGDGPLRAEKEKIARELNIKNITFLGGVPRRDVPKIIKGAAFLITPSEWYENAPYSILEAFSHGKPVIGSRIGGIPEMIIDGVTGLLFKPGDKNELTDKIRWFLAHPVERANLGRNGYAFVCKKYNPLDHYREITELYYRALKRN